MPEMPIAAQQADAGQRRRVAAVDIARGVALLAMAIYHFAWDLEFFGYAEPGMTAFGNWKLFARCIASSFLFLVGISLVLAHAGGVKWPSYWRRLAMVAGAAALISAATYIATPDTFIFFGILHQIALASLLGLAFLRLPWAVTALVAVAVIAAPHYLRNAFFDHPALWWVGLSSRNPPSNDYVPLFPWFGAVLLGMAAAKPAAAGGLFERLARWRPGGWSRPFAFGGRHSLAVYLIHQPVLIGLLWLFAQFAPAPTPTPTARFMPACQASCAETRDADFCTAYCGCALERLQSEGLLDSVLQGGQDADKASQLNEIAAACTIASEMEPEGEGQ